MGGGSSVQKKPHDVDPVPKPEAPSGKPPAKITEDTHATVVDNAASKTPVGSLDLSAEVDPSVEAKRVTSNSSSAGVSRVGSIAVSRPAAAPKSPSEIAAAIQHLESAPAGGRSRAASVYRDPSYGQSQSAVHSRTSSVIRDSPQSLASPSPPLAVTEMGLVHVMSMSSTGTPSFPLKPLPLSTGAGQSQFAASQEADRRTTTFTQSQPSLNIGEPPHTADPDVLGLPTPQGTPRSSVMAGGMASILELQHHTGDCENPVNFIDVPRADDGAVQVGLFDQYDNIRSICLQTSEAGVELSTSLLSGSTRLPSTLSTVFRIDDRLWLVSWCPSEGSFTERVRGAGHNDLAHVAVFDEDAAVMEAEERTSTSEPALNFHITVPPCSHYFPPPTSVMQTAPADFGCLLLLPTDVPLETQSNSFELPVIAPENVVLHAETVMLSDSIPSAGPSPIALEPKHSSSAYAMDVDRAVDHAWSRFGSTPYIDFETGLASREEGSDVSSPFQPASPPPEMGPMRLSSDAWVRWRRNTQRFSEMALCTLMFPSRGVYRVSVSVKRHLSALGTPRGISVIGAAAAAQEGVSRSPAPDSPGKAPRVNVPTLELLSASSPAQRAAAVAQQASGPAPPPPSMSLSTAGGASDDEGWISIATYIVHCLSTDTVSEPAHTFEPFASLGMWLAEHVSYRVETDGDNHCRTVLHVPRGVHLACQLRRGGIIYDEGWVRVHRSLDDTEVLIDTTVPERGTYSLVVLGSGPATENKFRQALVQQVVCETNTVCEAPAAVGELFQAIGLELDSHPFTVVTADEHNHVRISLIVPSDLAVNFKTQLRTGEATLSSAWVQTSRNDRDHKAIFDVSLPKPGVYKLLISASVESSPFTRVLTYYVNAQSDYVAAQPVAIQPPFHSIGVEPLTHRHQLIQTKDNAPLVIRWRIPVGMHMNATLKEDAKKLEAASYLTVTHVAEKEQTLVDVQVHLPPAKRPPKGAVVTQPVYVLSLFLRGEQEIGFKFLTSYLIQVSPAPVNIRGLS